MIRRNLIKATLITTVIACILTSTACGKKTANNNNTTSETKATVSAETKSIAAKELTKTELVTFDYTDEDGNTYTLEGKAVANESGDATIEVSDNNGNKVTFTGKAATTDGKMTVSGITVKDAGTLVKADGTEIKVTTGTTVADATKSDETTESDIAASEDVKREVETSKEEETIIEQAKESVTKAEESADNNDSNSNDTVIADNSGSDNNDNNNNSDNNGSGDIQETPVEDNKSDNNNSDNTPANPNPTPDVKEETPTPAPVEEEKKDETPVDDIRPGLHPGQPGYDYSAHTPIGANLYANEEGQIPREILVAYSKGELSAEQAEAKLLAKLGRNNSVEGAVDYEIGYWGNSEQVYILKCHFWVEDFDNGSLDEPYYTDYSISYPAFQYKENLMDYNSRLIYHCAYVVLPITM